MSQPCTPNVPRQPVRAEYWPQYAKLASRTRCTRLLGGDLFR